MNTARIFSLVTALLIMIATASAAEAQQRGGDNPRVSPNASAGQTIGTTVVEVTYGRPGVRDRVIFGDLVPYGEVWRTGANESTAITFSDPVRIEGEPLDAGSYSLYTIPGTGEWIIILNEELGWGTRYDASHDLFRVRVEPGQAPHQELFQISFRNVTEESGELVLHWEEVRVPVRIETD